jgi:hypothetical protein
MKPESESASMGAEQAWQSFDSIDDVRQKYAWVGNPDYPERTEEEAWQHLEQYLHAGDNEYVTKSELEEMGFAEKAPENTEE